MKSKLLLTATFLAVLSTIGCSTNTIATRKTMLLPVRSGVLAEFDFDPNSSFILIPVTINRKTYSFVLDTGSSHCLFDSSLRYTLGDKLPQKGNANTPSGDMKIDFYNSPTFFIGPMKIKGAGPVACFDLETIRTALGSDVHGIIGMSVLKNYIVHLDPDRGRVVFLRGLGSVEDLGVEVPMHSPRGYDYIIKVSFHDGLRQIGSEDFLLDTGCSVEGGLSYQLFDSLAKQTKASTSTTGGFSLGNNVIESRIIRLKSFFIESLKYNDLIFNDGQHNILGLGFLTRHIVTFDFPNKKLYLKEGRRFRRIDRGIRVGMSYLKKDGQWKIVYIVKGGPSEECGLRVGDIILKANDKDVSEMNSRKLNVVIFMAGHEEKVELYVKRNNEFHNITLTLRKLL